MNILVCVKQVPDTSEIKIDPVTHTLVRAGVPSIVNPFDRNAVEAAVKIKEEHGGTVTVISMGPPQAKVALRECLSVGADKAVLISDRMFGGSDTFATSYILSNAVNKLGKFDLILCGKQAIDGDTGQIGPELAEHLGIAQITYVAKIKIKDSNTIVVNREHEKGYEVIEAKFPILCTVVKSINEPRYPSIKNVIKAHRTPIEILNVNDLPNINKDKIGLKGSPTKVKKSFTPSVNQTCIKIREDNDKKSAVKLAEMLFEANLIKKEG